MNPILTYPHPFTIYLRPLEHSINMNNFIQFVDMVMVGEYTHDPLVETMRQELQSGKTPGTLEIYSALLSIWKTGVVDGVVCSLKRNIFQSEVESVNSFLESLARYYGGVNVAPLVMFESSLDEKFMERFTESYSKGTSKEVPFAVFPEVPSSKSDSFWLNFDEDVVV